MTASRLFAALAAASAASAAAPVAAQSPSPYDVTTYGVVWTVPEAKNVRVVRNVRYAGEGSGALVMDLAYPSGGDASTRWPAVVFVNGVGGKLNEWEIYKSWARLVAAHGLVGITAESDPGKPAESVRTLFAYLEKESAALRIDSSRLAVWACSGNVSAALPRLMDGAPAGIRAAVILYGTGNAATLRKDLPVYWVLAGRDSPSLIEGQRTLWTRAVREGAPWTMINAPDLPHAFDAIEDTSHSRQIVRDIVEFLVAGLAPARPPPPPAPLPRRAAAYMYANEPDKAAAVYREILAADPKDREAQRLLGLALTRQGKASEAVEVLRRAVELGNDGPAIRRALGEALLHAGKPAEAADHLKKAVDLGANAPPLIYNLACAYALSGRKDDAFARLTEVAGTGWLTREQLEGDADLASLRSDPRFGALLSKLPAASAPR
ncbi:MAG TPA: tetratricopeptide repeat protein [Thermoanaerobaculia bacterium]|nr:tetratricopeptide repeat protein [Thermoanaerobaculia bacterium]